VTTIVPSAKPTQSISWMSIVQLWTESMNLRYEQLCLVHKVR